MNASHDHISPPPPIDPSYGTRIVIAYNIVIDGAHRHKNRDYTDKRNNRPNDDVDGDSTRHYMRIPRSQVEKWKL